MCKRESAGLWHDTRESALGQQGEQAGQVGEPGAGGQATHISNSALRVPRGLSYHTRKSPCRLCSAEPLVSSKPEQQQQVWGAAGRPSKPTSAVESQTWASEQTQIVQELSSELDQDENKGHKECLRTSDSEVARKTRELKDVCSGNPSAELPLSRL